jgi:hypothetical protein
MPRGLPSSVAQVHRRLTEGRSCDWARRELAHLARRAEQGGEPGLAAELRTCAAHLSDHAVQLDLAAVITRYWPERTPEGTR